MSSRLSPASAKSRTDRRLAKASSTDTALAGRGPGSETLSPAAIAVGPSASDVITAATTTLPTPLISSHDSHPTGCVLGRSHRSADRGRSPLNAGIRPAAPAALALGVTRAKDLPLPSIEPQIP